MKNNLYICEFKRGKNMFSAISAIRSQFAVGQQHSTGFGMQQGAAAKMSMSRGADGSTDEVFYAGLNDADANFDLQMIQDSLYYEAFKDMDEQDRE